MKGWTLIPTWNVYYVKLPLYKQILLNALHATLLYIYFCFSPRHRQSVEARKHNGVVVCVSWCYTRVSYHNCRRLAVFRQIVVNLCFLLCFSTWTWEGVRIVTPLRARSSITGWPRAELKYVIEDPWADLHWNCILILMVVTWTNHILIFFFLWLTLLIQLRIYAINRLMPKTNTHTHTHTYTQTHKHTHTE